MLWILLLVTALSLLVFYLKWTFEFWDRKGFPTVGKAIPFGALDSVFRGKRSFGLAIYDLYKAGKEPVVGMYLALRPALLIRDAQLAHDILVKDFASFHDRGIYVDEENDPTTAGLFSLEGSQWKTMRNKLTPSFTSGKLKAMFSTSEAIGDKMLAHLESVLPQNGSKEIDIKQLTTTYAIDIIASTIFGLDVDSFANPNNEFENISRGLLAPSVLALIRGTAVFLYPPLEKLLFRLGIRQEAEHQLRNLVHSSVKFREDNNVIRKDMLQLLLQLRNTGNISKDDSIWSAGTTKTKTLSVDHIVGHLSLFLVAGYETTASSIAFTLFELTQNPEVLAKAKEDVESALEKHNGKLSYDAIQDMKYLELCIMETARKYPALPILNRECTKDYQVPGSNLTIKNGTPIVISLMGLHRDEEHFPNPLSYEPERYLEEQRNYNPTAYMPFGEGPRHCIGLRMGKVNAKIALAKILSNFNIEECQEKREIEFTIHGVTIMPEDGVPIKVSRKK